MMSSSSRRTDRVPAVLFSLIVLLPLSCQSHPQEPHGANVPTPTTRTNVDHIIIEAKTDGRRWSGWGCSLSWWANVFGQRDDVADALFSDHPNVSVHTNKGSVTLPGLGLNVVRYNIGGSGENTDKANGAGPNNPPVFTPFKRIQGFWLDWNNPGPTSSSWDWSRDANQRAMLQKARQRGANLFEAFSTSPMWWMNKNKSSAGGNNGGENLQTWNQNDFAHYLATVTRVAADQWNIPFHSIAPFNEPSAPWWSFPGGQEGCHFDHTTQSAVIQALRKELDKQGLRDVSIAACEENSIDDTLATWKALNKPAQSAVGQVNTHGYYGLQPYRGQGRRPLSETVRGGGKRLTVSEYGDPDRTAHSLAVSLLQDLRELRPDSWIYWQPLDGANWGLIDADMAKGTIGLPTCKWYVLAQFSRHLRPGMVFLPCSGTDCIAAYDAKQSKLVIITVNQGNNRHLAIDLSGFRAVTGAISVWRTDLTDVQTTQRYRLQNAPERTGMSFGIESPAGTVQTIEITGVHL